MNYKERPVENIMPTIKPLKQSTKKKAHKFIHSGQGDYIVVYCQNCGIVAYDCGKWVSEGDQEKINKGCPLG